jgi:hypothetical protein
MFFVEYALYKGHARPAELARQGEHVRPETMDR